MGEAPRLRRPATYWLGIARRKLGDEVGAASALRRVAGLFATERSAPWAQRTRAALREGAAGPSGE